MSVTAVRLSLLCVCHCCVSVTAVCLSLQVLGIRTITFADIIDGHILPAFKSAQVSPSQTKSDQGGPSQTKSDQVGPSQTKSDQAGPSQTKSDQACDLTPDILVSFLAFISLSGLLKTGKADAGAPSTTEGRSLLKQLQQWGVLCTDKGPVRVASRVPVYFPVSLGNQVGFDADRILGLTLISLWLVLYSTCTYTVSAAAAHAQNKKCHGAPATSAELPAPCHDQCLGSTVQRMYTHSVCCYGCTRIKQQIPWCFCNKCRTSAPYHEQVVLYSDCTQLRLLNAQGHSHHLL